MSEIEAEYRRLRERSRLIARKMDARLFGAAVFSMIALVEAGGLAYNEVENSGKVDAITGVAAAGLIFGAGGAIRYSQEYKDLKSQLIESDEEFQSFRNSILFPPAREVPPLEGWGVIDIDGLNGPEKTDS